MTSGATLAGVGNAQGPVDVENGGAISPGLSPGTIMTGDLDLMDGSNFDIQIDAPGAVAGTDYDEIEVTGSVTIGDVNFNISGTDVPTVGDEFIIIDNDGTADAVILGAGAPAEASVVGMLNGIPLKISYLAGDGNDVSLSADANTNVVLTADDLVVGTGGDGGDDTFTIINNGANVEVLVNGTVVSSTAHDTTTSISIKGSIDDDTLVVDNSNGLITATIKFDGDGTKLDPTNLFTANPVIAGPGFDTLQLIGSTPTDTTYNPGMTSDAGAVFQVAGSVTQRVEFVGLEPVQVVGAGAGDTINLGQQLAAAGFPAALNASNAISYTTGPNSGVAPFVGMISGLVTVDGFETIEFANYGVLLINAGPGDDTINLEYTTTAPTNLTFIVGNGGLGRDAIDASGDTTGIPLMLFGGADDDTLVGGLGGDILLGGIGNDTLVDSGGNDYFDGGNNGQIPAAIPASIGFPAVPGTLVLPPAVADPISATGGVDAVVVRGSGLGDVLNVVQNAPTGAAGSGYPLAVVNSAGGAVIPAATADILATVAAGAVPNVAASRSSIEDVRIEAGAGNDQIAVAHADVYSGGAGTPQQMVRFDVRGDAPDASDRLVVQDLGLGDLVLIRQSANERTRTRDRRAGGQHNDTGRIQRRHCLFGNRTCRCHTAQSVHRWHRRATASDESSCFRPIRSRRTMLCRSRPTSVT